MASIGAKIQVELRLDGNSFKVIDFERQSLLPYFPVCKIKNGGKFTISTIPSVTSAIDKCTVDIHAVSFF